MREVLEAAQPWTLLSVGAWSYGLGWGVDRQRDALKNGYAANLAKFCPNVIITDDNKAANTVLHQYVYGRRLSSGAEMGNIYPERARILTTSIAFLNGGLNQLFGGLPRVSFQGEPGIDAGGVRRDWFANIVKAVFESPSTDPLGALFTTVNRAGDEGGDYLVWDDSKELTPANRNAYKAAGRLLAYVMANRLPAVIPLTHTFYGILIRGNLDVADVTRDQAGIGNGIRDVNQAVDDLSSPDPATVAAAEEMLSVLLDIDWTVDPRPTIAQVEAQAAEFARDSVRPLYPVGPRSDAKMAAFREGFNDLLPIDYLRAGFSPSVVKALATVSEPIDPEDIIAHAVVQWGPRNPAGDAITWLWAWLREADQPTLRKFIQFITGLPTLPPGGVRSLHRPLTLTNGGTGNAPLSHTCFYSMELPNYRTEALLREYMPACISADGFGMG